MSESTMLKSGAKTEHFTSFDKEVEDVLSELSLKSDSLDSPDFDVVAYINEMFPTEQSLANIDEVISETEQKVHELELETREIIRGQWPSEDEGQEVVQEAMQMIKTLFSRIRDVQERATRSEEMVRDITKDIQQLDQAKRNLTVSITTLNNLILIVNALDRLNELLKIKPLGDGTVNNDPVASQPHNDSKNPFAEDETGTNGDKTSKPISDKMSLSMVSEVFDLLSQVQRLIQPMLAAYQSVPSVKGLARELDMIHSVLAERLMRELKVMLSGSRQVTENAPLVQSICQLIELLPEALKVKPNLLSWFISRQLAEYRELFDPTQTVAWIDKVDHRYAWLRSNLPPMERKLQTFFPSSWHVTEELVVEFCHITRIDLETVMNRRQAELTHNLVIFGLQRTLAFEFSLNKIYPNYALPDSHQCPAVRPPKKSLNPFDDDENERDAEESAGCTVSTENQTVADSEVDDSGWKKQAFDGLISSCFDAHFDLYLNHVEKALRDQLHNRLIGDFTVNKSSLTNRELSDVFKDGGSPSPVTLPATSGASDSGENTLYSATDLFLLYKQIIKQTLQLNRGHGLLGLVRLLRQYLSEYTMWVLLAQIPGISIGKPGNPGSGNTGTGLFAPEMTAKMAAFGLSGLSALGIGRGQSVGSTTSEASKSQGRSNITATEQGSSVPVNQLFANLLREDQQVPRLTTDEVQKVCVVLVTAAFCLKTVEELEKRLKLEVRPPSWSAKISFASELDGFAACRSVCVHRLVSDLEAAAEPQLAAMARLPWNNLIQVGDQSVYVTEIVKHLRSQVPLIRDTLYTVRATFTQICIKFAGALITRFTVSLYRCKPVNTFGAEQLLLDTQSLKSALLQMPVFGAKFSQAPPRSFTNLVHEGMGRAERIIKAVMLPVGSAGSSQLVNSESTHSTASGFIMGPVDESAAQVFLTSYRQLLPDATSADLQKVLDMKGVKAGEQQLILDLFRTQCESSKPCNSHPDSGTTGPKLHLESEAPDISACSAVLHSPRPSSRTDSVQPAPTGRIGHFEKLVKKRR
ncbi:hypothetical protein EG68_03715 [Paragonimus skrjabini miyazakii]|uniref:Vacuolar protein sorting-associated protein 53 homolog n=1 Tax=Paragonimus skrjabini miyazakii TaxID=59628 RepID=A0A8S9Z0J3_9TREM|nr:hypothetical protein EG68_03715 [Paragonimus skrjabini miyazakii]